MHEVHLIELAVGSIEEMDVLTFRDDTELLSHALRLFHAALAHDGIMEAVADAGRGHDEDVGSLGPPAVHAFGLEDQPFHTRADAGGIGVEPLFDVVGTQHDDEQIDDFMALEERISHAQSVHRLMDGVHENGRPARKTLFRHEIVAAKRRLQAAGPALVLIEADAVVGTVRRVGTVAVGVGIAQTKDMFFHRLFPFQISPRDWRK